jgi:outer membrane protein OmpA-like peptidoglycan-associated protein
MKKVTVLVVLTTIVNLTLFNSVQAQQMDERAKSDSAQPVQVAAGQKVKMKGVIVMRQNDGLTLRDQRGSDLMIRLTAATKVEEKKHNPFRGAKRFEATHLIRGLPVQVEGRGDSSGNVVADKIKFSDQDLMIALSLESQLVPVEDRVNRAESRLRDAEQNAQRLSGQMGELSEVANQARGGAKAAQQTADEAIARVNWTNERITALDDYEVRNGTMIHFKAGSAKLSPEAEAMLDEIAMQAKGEKAFFLEVTGFASADGPEELNRRLSEQRARAVIRYLIETHEIPLRRVLLPYGFGELQPVADNATQEGRQQNRRVEVKLLVSRGHKVTDS